MARARSTPPRPFDAIVPAAIAFTLFWGWVALTKRPIGDFGVETDFYGDFAVYAREWGAGHATLMNGFRGPFYYVLLAALGKLIPDLFLLARLISVIAAGAALWLTGDLVARLWNRPAGLMAVFLVGSSLAFIDYSYRACNDLLFLALVMGSLRLLFVDSGPLTPRAWGSAGLLAGLAWMTRYNGSILVPAALLIAPILHGRTRRALVAAALFVAGWILVTLPWLLFVASRTGTPFWNKAYENIAIEALTDDPDRAQVLGFMSATDIRSLGDVIAVDPGRFVSVMLGNVVDHLVLDAKKLVGIPWAIVAALGFAVAIPLLRDRRRIAFAVAGLLTYVSLLPIFYNERFMLPLLPFWGAAAGGWLAWLATKTRLRWPVPLALAAGAVLAVALSVTGYRLATDMSRFGGLPVEYLALANDVRARGTVIGPTTPISARKPHFSYLFGAPTVGVPTGSLEELRASGAHFLLVSGSEINVFPSLAPLWHPDAKTQIPTGLRLAGTALVTREGGGRGAASLYALTDPLPYTPRESSPFKTIHPVPPGFSRIDFLRLQLGEWYVRSGAAGQTEKLIGMMSAAARENPRTQLLLGASATRDGHLDAAEAAFRKALEADSTRKIAALGLAGVAAISGRTDDHRAWIHRAFGLPDSAAWPAAATMSDETAERLRVGDATQAIGAARGVLAVDPTNTRARMALVYAFEALNRMADATEAAQAVLRQSPNDPEATAALDSIRKFALKRK